MEPFCLLAPAVLLVMLAVRLMAGALDHDRIRAYVEARGGTMIEAGWEPFGPGWFGEKGDRIYFVRYRDRAGNEHKAHCKTSMLSGVYFTEDRITRHAEQPAAPPAESESLEAENRRLREELERLRRERG